MKKLLLLTGIITLLFSFQLIAQVVPNGSFEVWENFVTYEDPESWTTPNEASSPVSIFTVTKESTDVYDGVFAARLESMFIVLLNVPGMLTLGELTVDYITQEFSITGGIPFTGRPSKLKGWFKYTPNGPDACFAYAVFTKFNGATSDTIGFGMYSSMETVDTWTQFEAPVTYFNSENPDTMNILILSSSITAAQPGSVMLVDKLELDYGVGVEEESLKACVDFYHDQSNKALQINYRFVSEQIVSVSLFNIVGQPVKEFRERKVMNGQEVIDIGGYPAGVYMLEVRSGTDRMVRKLIF